MTQNRRAFISKTPAVVAAAAAPAAVVATQTDDAEAAHRPPWHEPDKEVHWPDGEPDEDPLFSPIATYGGMVFISGIGAHFDGDITAHTEHVLDQVEMYLESVGSSMEKVLKVNVYLNDLADYDAMNEVYLGRFGPEPGVRTTIAAARGIPGGSLVEIDCIACR